MGYNQPSVGNAAETADEGNDNEYLTEFLDLKGIYALEHIEDNLGSITPAQAEALTSRVANMDLDIQDKNYGAAVAKQGEVLKALQQKITAEKIERQSGRPNLRLVDADFSAEEISTAKDRLQEMQEIFGHQKDFLDDGTLGKVEKWQKELGELERVLGSDVIGPLNAQMELFRLDFKRAKEAKRVEREKRAFTAQHMSKPVAEARDMGPALIPQEKKKPFWKFW